MRAALLGLGVTALLGLATVAASWHGSPLRAGAPEGSDLPSTVFLAAAGGAFTLYLGGLVLLRRSRAGLATVCALAAAIQLVPLAGPLLLSRDVFAYWDYGRLAAAHDANPYSAPPARFAQDPAERAMAPAWRHSDSVYGPVFTTASAGLAATGGHSSESAALAYRLLAATGMLLLIALAALVGPVPAFAAAFVGWNPLLALDFAGGGHNDVWMMVLVLGGLALAAARPRLAGVSWALAAGVKWIAIALLPLELLGRTQREALRMLLGFAAAAAAIGAVAWLLSCWRSRGCCAPRGPGAPAWRPRPASCSSRAPGSFPGMQSGPCRSQPSRKTGPRGPSRWAFAPISCPTGSRSNGPGLLPDRSRIHLLA